MLRSDKERIVGELTERLQATETLIVADYRGLTMKEVDALRGELLQHGAKFTIVKNSLTRRAAEAAGADTVLALLDGPTAIAFLETDGDPVAVAKALADAARTTKVLAVRGGVLEGRVMTADEVGRAREAAAARRAARPGARGGRRAAVRDRRAVHGAAAGSPRVAAGADRPARRRGGRGSRGRRARRRGRDEAPAAEASAEEETRRRRPPPRRAPRKRQTKRRPRRPRSLPSQKARSRWPLPQE